MENKRKFHVVITNNETGEVMIDKQSNGIIAAIEHEQGTAAFVSINCDGGAFVKLLVAARGVCDDIGAKHPEIEKMAQIASLFHKACTDLKEDADKNTDLNDADTD